MIEGVEVDTAHGHAAGIDVQQNAPDFFLGRVQTDDHDGIGVHVVSSLSVSQGRLSGIANRRKGYVGITAGPLGGRRSFGSVRDWTRSIVVSAAISRRTRPCGVTSMKPSSVTMWSTTSTPVRGSVHCFRILGLPSRVACSIAT